MSHSDEHFRLFAGQIERAILKYGSLDEITVVERQKKQVEQLVALERKFRKTLIKHPWGPGAYKAFIYHIINERRNILAARPFFRERQEVFTTKIAKALKKEKANSLYKFHFNYQFIRFVMGLRKWPKGGQIAKLANEIGRLRTEIVEMNMPLAISRARIFWSRTPRSHLGYMDLIQISCEGLMSAVDKFVLPYSTVFRSVAIGRIVGNLIENYSETLVHFYPQDKRKIYRANKMISRLGDSIDFEKLADHVNLGVETTQKTDESEISRLVAAASTVSTATATVTGDESGECLERYAAETTVQPDVQFENTQALHVLRESVYVLNSLERKLLKMKGITL